MASDLISSVQLTNADAEPRVPNSPIVDGGTVKEKIGIVETLTAAADTSSIYRMVRVPSSCRISGVWLMTDDMGTTGAVNVGVHQTAENGGAVVDADLFGSAIDVNTAAVAMTSIMFESGQITLDETAMPLWKVLGVASDPGIDYDITIMPSTAFTDLGTMLLKVQYVV